MDQDEAMFGAEVKPQKPKRKLNWTKIGVVIVSTLVGLSHIGMIGTIANRRTTKLPEINLPVGPYTSYKVEASKEGYKIAYKSNDPKVMYTTKDIKTKGGFLGLSNNTQKSVEEYTMTGDVHIKPESSQASKGTLKSEACIEAIGAAKGTGKLVGTSMGAAAAPAVSGIPFVGWVAAGWIAMFGGEQGAQIGGNMAEDLNKDC